MTTIGLGATHQGQKRANNEDSMFFDDAHGIYMVCDGMGGHMGGEEASQMAVEMISGGLLKDAQWKGWFQDKANHPLLLGMVRGFVEEACAAIYKAGQANLELKGMGTTLTLLLIQGDKGLLAHVGDSRLYMLRDEAVYQLSADHTLLQEFLNRDILTPEEAKGHSYGHILTRALGQQPSVEVDLLLFDVYPEDQFVLCSDGMSNYLEKPEALLGLVQGVAFEGLAQSLVDWANQQGGSDNITVIAVQQPAPVELDTTLRDTSQAAAWNRTSRLSFYHLSDSFLCKGMQMRHIMRLFNIVSTQAYEQEGEVVFQAGSPAQGLYIVLEGSCQISQAGYFPRTLQKGQSFALDSLTIKEPALETVTTLEPSLLLKLGREDFLAFTRKRPRMGTRLLKNVVQEQSRRWRMFKQMAVNAIQNPEGQ